MGVCVRVYACSGIISSVQQTATAKPYVLDPIPVHPFLSLECVRRRPIYFPLDFMQLSC